MWLIWFVFGLVMGSAANALIDRLPRKESWIKGRSKCDKCGHELNWQDLVPVFSYLSLGGKCRYCHSPIPFRNLIVELVTGTAFVVINWQTSSFSSLILSLIAVVTVIIAVMDWETMLVSEVMVVAWAVLVLISQFLIFNFQFLINSLISQFSNNAYGLIIGVGLVGGLWLVTRGRAMGAGDMEIAAVLGWWLGGEKTLIAMWLAFVIGAVVGVWQMARGKAGMKSEIAFGPFLIVGAWIAYSWGNVIWRYLGFG